MNRQPVTSSNIKSVGYHEGTLQVEFHSGRIYEYLDVAPPTHVALMRAISKGQFFAEHIRDRYETREVMADALPDFDALVNGIAVWQDEDKRGVYLDNAKRLYALGITDTEMLRALLTTLYQTAASNVVSVLRRPLEDILPTAPPTTLQERIVYPRGGKL